MNMYDFSDYGRQKEKIMTYHIYDLKENKFYQTTDGQQFVYSKKGNGKVFKDIGKAKLHCLFLVGITMPPKEILDKEEQLHLLMRKVNYNRNSHLNFIEQMEINSPEAAIIRNEINEWHALHPGYNEIPEWLTNHTPIDMIPNTWEIWEINKKIKTKVDFDLQEYVIESKKLRKLTDSFGTAVKDVYKKLDKAQKLIEFPHVAAIGYNIDNLKTPRWYENIKIDVDAVDSTISALGIKKNSYVRSSKKDSIAIAFKELTNAFMFKMTYGGSDRVVVLDMKNLEEVIQTA